MIVQKRPGSERAGLCIHIPSHAVFPVPKLRGKATHQMCLGWICSSFRLPSIGNMKSWPSLNKHKALNVFIVELAPVTFYMVCNLIPPKPSLSTYYTQTGSRVRAGLGPPGTHRTTEEIMNPTSAPRVTEHESASSQRAGTCEHCREGHYLSHKSPHPKSLACTWHTGSTNKY